MADTLSEKLREWEKRTAQAEQDLTAARAALMEIRVEAAMGAYNSDGTIGGGLTASGCLDIVSACDTALAASAPQKPTKPVSRHVCGAQGYCPGPPHYDPICPGCKDEVDRRNAAAHAQDGTGDIP